MRSYREILAALQRLKSGAASLTSDQYVALLDAVEQAAEALHAAPRGSDPIATGLWYNHERAPALARLADALTSHDRATASHCLTEQLRSDHEVARALHQSLLDSAGI